MSASHREGLFRHSLLLMGATMVANVSNTLFQIVMGWSLGVEEYGVLVSMLSMILIVGTPLDAIRTAMAHFSAKLDHEGRRGEIRPLVLGWFKGVTWFCVPVAVVGILFSGPLARFFRLETRVPIIITSIMVGGTPYLPILAGALQGVQAFVWMAVSQHSWSIVRLLAGAALVLLVSRTASAALIGQCIGVVACFGLGLWALDRVVGPPRHGERLVGVKRYFARSLVVLAGFALLMFADGPLVKHYFTPEEAGTFARATMIARSVIFLIMPIALAMFPKVTSSGEVSSHDWVTLAKAVLFAAALVALAMGVCSVVPQLPLLILYGVRSPDAETVRLVRFVVWAMAPLSLVYMLMNFEMAQHRFRTIFALIPCAAGYVAGVIAWHGSLFRVAAVLGAASGTALVWLIAGLPWRRRSPPAA